VFQQAPHGGLIDEAHTRGDERFSAGLVRLIGKVGAVAQRVAFVGEADDDGVAVLVILADRDSAGFDAENAEAGVALVKDRLAGQVRVGNLDLVEQVEVRAFQRTPLRVRATAAREATRRTAEVIGIGRGALNAQFGTFLGLSASAFRLSASAFCLSASAFDRPEAVRCLATAPSPWADTVRFKGASVKMNRDLFAQFAP
jgi:hypothetical protein